MILIWINAKEREREKERFDYNGVLKIKSTPENRRKKVESIEKMFRHDSSYI